MPRILFIAAHRPDRSPGQRYRFEQFEPYWNAHGYQTESAWLIDEADDALFYAPGRVLDKARIFAKSWKRRLGHVRRASHYDLIFLQREAFMTGSLRFERGFKRSGKPIVYDFDDAIWNLDVSQANRRLGWLKDPGKTAHIIGMADAVIAGNEYLAAYARQHNPDVTVIPTTVDTDVYVPRPHVKGDRFVIGWIGSHTSMTHLYKAEPILRAIVRDHGERVVFRVVSDVPFDLPGIPVENVRWTSAGEAEAIAGFDCGIMPMPDDEWSKGKCGFKGIQYMAMGKPAILSPVGVNNSIVQHHVNGFLANGPGEWSACIGSLMEDDDLCRRLGDAARLTVEQHYSVIAWRDVYLQLFDRILGRTPSHDRPQAHSPLARA